LDKRAVIDFAFFPTMGLGGDQALP
jgi:hypothetical protein